jgi:hypothetical protein
VALGILDTYRDRTLSLGYPHSRVRGAAGRRIGKSRARLSRQAPRAAKADPEAAARIRVENPAVSAHTFGETNGCTQADHAADGKMVSTPRPVSRDRHRAPRPMPARRRWSRFRDPICLALTHPLRARIVSGRKPKFWPRTNGSGAASRRSVLHSWVGTKTVGVSVAI